MFTEPNVSFPFRLEYKTKETIDTTTSARAFIANEELLKIALDILVNHYEGISVYNFKTVTESMSHRSPLWGRFRAYCDVSYLNIKSGRSFEFKSGFEKDVYEDKVPKTKLKSFAFFIFSCMVLYAKEANGADSIKEIKGNIPEMGAIGDYFGMDAPEEVKQYLKGTQRKEIVKLVKDLTKPSTESNTPIIIGDYVIIGENIEIVQKTAPVKKPSPKSPRVSMEVPRDGELKIKNAQMGEDGVITVYGIDSNGREIKKEYRSQE